MKKHRVHVITRHSSVLGDYASLPYQLKSIYERNQSQ